jgi:hypothetical protein
MIETYLEQSVSCFLYRNYLDPALRLPFDLLKRRKVRSGLIRHCAHLLKEMLSNSKDKVDCRLGDSRWMG